MRVGLGYDVHRLFPGRKLVLGGVEIPFEKGLAGHSDADVLCHAIMDALLGAAGLPDIGAHFPDSDNKFKDISSLALMGEIRELLYKDKWLIINIDATIIAEGPRLSPWREKMKEKVAQALEINRSQIGLKFTTNEGLGFLGRGEGIAALAAALINQK